MTVRIVHKNSTAEDKRPTASQLANGEIAVNLHSSGAFLTVKDTDGNIQQVGGVKVSSDSPQNPVLGTLWVDSDDNRLYVYNGTTWLLVTGAGGGPGGGNVNQINAGNGIQVANGGGPIVTVTVRLEDNADRPNGGNGLEFNNGQLRGRIATADNLGVVRVGSNLAVDGNGTISVDGAITGGLTYKGTLDIVGGDASAEPTTRAAGDTYTSTQTGAITTAGTGGVNWQNLLVDTGNTTVGDLIICRDAAGGNGSWVIVRTGGLEFWENPAGDTLQPSTNTHVITAATVASGTDATTATGIIGSTDTGAMVRFQPKNGIEFDGGQIQIAAGTIPLPGGGNGNGNFGFWSRDNANANISPRTDGDDIFLTASSASVAADERVVFRGNNNRDVSLSGPTTNLGASWNLKLPGDVAGNAPAIGDVIAVQAINGTELTSQWISPGEMQPNNGSYGFWERNDANNTLEPRTQGDDIILKSQDAEFLRLQGTDNTPAARDIVLRAPTGLAGWAAGTTTYTFPSVPVNGRVLSTDAAGTLSWVAQSGQSPFQQTGTEIHTRTGGSDLRLTANAVDVTDERIIFRGNDSRDVVISGPNAGVAAGGYRMILPAAAPGANTNFLGVGAIAGNVITLAWENPPAAGGGQWNRDAGTTTLTTATPGDNVTIDGALTATANVTLGNAAADVIGMQGVVTIDGRFVNTPEQMSVAGAWDASNGNIWRTNGATVANPTNTVTGQTGLIIVEGAAVTGWGNAFDWAGGQGNRPANVPVNSVLPYYVQTGGGTPVIYVGNPVEAFG